MKMIAMTATVLFAYSEILHNSLLIRAAGIGAAHKASGLALSLGNLFSVLALAFTAWAFALPGWLRSCRSSVPVRSVDRAMGSPMRSPTKGSFNRSATWRRRRGNRDGRTIWVGRSRRRR